MTTFAQEFAQEKSQITSDSRPTAYDGFEAGLRAVLFGEPTPEAFRGDHSYQGKVSAFDGFVKAAPPAKRINRKFLV